MKVLGIIVEYNPLHIGHMHHLKSSLKLVKPDFTVAIMSGNFVQRGEPAIVDKFARAEMALKAGVDVVFEIPVIYSIQDASGFAFGSVASLNCTNAVTNIVFGSESNDIQTLSQMASLIVEEPGEYQRLLKKYLKKGLSFPNARRYAISDVLSQDGVDTDQIQYSNNILGVEYLASLKRLRSKMAVSTIGRKGSSYNEEKVSEVPSATALRKAILEDRKLSGLPEFSLEILEREMNTGRGPIFMRDLFEFMRFKILMLSREGLEELYGFNEGIAKRMVDALDGSNDMNEFLKRVKTKRFTFTRIKRRTLYAIFDVKRDFVMQSNEFGPQYLRVLGFTKKGKQILRVISDHSSIPLISNVSNFNKSLEKRNVNISLAKKQFEFDLKATDFYSLLFKKERERKLHRDFRKPVEI